MAIKIGIMSSAHLHADSYAHCFKNNPRAQLVGIADDDTQRAHAKAQQFETKAFDSYETLLNSDADAVVICSENVRHAPLTLQAAMAGKHILCEKPLMTTLEDGLAMLQTCQRENVQLFTAFPCRFSPAMRNLKAMLEAGEIGDLLAIRGTNRGSNPHGWFTNPALSGGGAMIDHTVHVTDLMRWLLKQEVVEVYAETNNLMFHGNYEDTAMLTMTFQDGLFATLDSSWSRPRTFPTWGDVTLGVFGTKGVIEMDMFAQHMVHYNDKANRISHEFWGDNIDKGLTEAFVDVIETGSAPDLATGYDGYKAAEVALSAYESVRQGAPVTITH